MGKVIAAYGGGFKPPTKGHFQIVKNALEEFPEIDEFIVYVGNKERDGIDQAEAILVWEIYENYLSNKVTIKPSDGPIGDVLRLAKNNPQDEIYFIIGYRDSREDDIKDAIERTSNLEEKYPNIKIKEFTTSNPNMSGTNARKALEISEEEFIKFLPSEVKEKEEIFTILKPAVTEEEGKAAPYGSGYEKLNEHSMGSSIDLESQIDRLTQHMLDKDYNIEPLPALELIDDDTDNAQEFLGKTAYYNPNTQTIVLYTHGRHPKDIVRSYAHEMIHHIQNLEGRLEDITTTNTQEDDNLNNIEAEANLKGTMTFRNWTDSVNEAIVGDKIECDNCGWDWNIVDGGDDLFICHKCGHDNTPLNETNKPYSKNKDYFGINKLIKEIVEEPKYKIFSDMDGVLTDFDTSFQKASDGVPPEEYEKKYGKDKFWELIDGEGVEYWTEMPYMVDGERYWNYIKDYDVELLSSPSRSSTSRLGKRLWVKNNMPGVKLTLAQSSRKQNYAAPDHILIDDRKSNIDQWIAAGGIGILHTSAAGTISQLKKLGL